MKRIANIAFAIGVSSALYGQSTTNAPIYKINTVAGQDFLGDANPRIPGSGRATGASLLQPDAVIFDSAGNMYIADSIENRVRRVDAVTGAITTIAGTGAGSGGFDASSEGKPAVNARLSTPSGLAFDPAGNLYIADRGNHRIRRVDLNGIITTVAGEAPISGNATTGGTTNGYTGDNRKATLAHLNSPSGIASDQAGNLYIADTTNNRIRKVDTNGIITTFAGNGVASNTGDGGPAVLASLWNPEGVLADVNGNVFIADTRNNRIRLVNPSGIISTVAGTCLPLFSRSGTTGQSVSIPCAGGTANGSSGGAAGFSFPGIAGSDGSLATQAPLNAPRGLALDVNGNLYVADSCPLTGTPAACTTGTGFVGSNNRIRIISPSGVINTVAGGGTLPNDGVQALRASLNVPRAVTIDPNGRVVFADSLNGRIKAIDPVTGTIVTLAGQSIFGGDGGPGPSAFLSNPRGVAVDGAGNIYIADTNNNRIREVTGGIINTIAGTGAAGFAGDLSATQLIAPATSARLSAPSCIASSAGGLVYFADRGNNRVRRIASDGTITTIAGNGTSGFSGNGQPAVNAMLNSPNCVALDSTGQILAIADTGNNAIRLITLATGLISTPAGNCNNATGVCVSGSSGDGDFATFSYLNGPQGVAIDPSGNIFIADTGNHLVREILAANGVIQTVAGISGSSGSDGDDADVTTGLFNARIDPPAVGSRLNLPGGVATDSVGNIYIADSANNRIRRVNAAQTYIQTIAGNTISPGFTEGGLGNTALVTAPSAITVDSAGNVYFTDRIGVVRQLTPNAPPSQQN